MKRIFATAILALVSVGCAHPQVPVTNHIVDLTWQAPAVTSGWLGCTATNPCGYVISKLVAASGASSCGAPSATAVYTPLNQNVPATGLAYTDSSSAGETVCYIVQTVQGAAVSAPSNTSLAVVPGNPTAPILNSSPAVSNLVQPAQPMLRPTLPQMALLGPTRPIGEARLLIAKVR